LRKRHLASVQNIITSSMVFLCGQLFGLLSSMANLSVITR